MTHRSLLRPTWDTYLRQFHQDKPGITETILNHSRCGAQNPYQWLTEGLTDPGVVFDLACGSAPTRGLVGQRWIGLDASRTELLAGGPGTIGKVALGDLARLPFGADSCDVVLCSMALMLIEPLDQAVGEILRVLRPGGVVRLLLPARSPLTVRDRVRYIHMSAALRTSDLFPPNPLHHNPGRRLGGAGLTILHDDTLRFAYPVTSGDAAARFVDCLYLPDADPDHLQAVRRIAARWLGTDVGLPLRRLVATAAAAVESGT